MMKALDDLYIEYLKMKFALDKSLITILRNKIFEMYEQKMVVKSKEYFEKTRQIINTYNCMYTLV